ncbi:basic amino acid/polyamine antiporter, APA family [Parapedobacter composti]|uniref:Basic amino acid/polyamine antiporter, APA family n=1 Tax=Parapedobacter composti TaxID=623281 RepID=A0A1I1KEJ2_9SPHI|nr:amino acid permease [Parapedobacter composti]SFC59236.1 basic amino acid/polyamine antiporter, APA family [Parapedobacter composti]
MEIKTTLKRTVSGSSAVLLVVSAVVGSGVFKKVVPMAESLHDGALILTCWLAAGLLSMIGALCTAELAAMMPGSGGEYVYFRKIYGRFFAFLYGWANLVVMRSATVAALAFVFSQSLYALLPPAMVAGWGSATFVVKVVATLLVVLLSSVNYRGVLFGTSLSRVFIIGIVAAMLLFIGYAYLGYDAAEPVSDISGTAVIPSAATNGFGWVTAFFAASLAAFWGYEGWNNVGYIGEEVKNPQKNIPLALILGTGIIIVLYLLMNAAYLRIMPVEAYAAMMATPEKIAAVEAASVMSGPIGGAVLSILILCSTFNCTNSTILLSSRIFYALSKDRLFLPFASKVHPRFGTPANAIVLQAAWACGMIWMGSFDQLTDLLIFAAFIFYGATALGVLLLRRQHPEMERPYRALGYPVLPALFFTFCLALVVITIVGSPLQSLMGLGLIAAGVPVYFYFVKHRGSSAER